MKLQKSIEILKSYLDEQRVFPNSDLAHSLKLGIEALRCIRKLRNYPFPDEVLLLPGETQD